MFIASDLARYWRFAWQLRKFLGQSLDLEQCQRIILQRLTDRDKMLLAIFRAIYDNLSSPYLQLLRLAGCEYGDLERTVLSDGIEATLGKLRDAGIYLSYEEFKGGKEVVRGSQRFRFKERDFDNPLSARHLALVSSASRSIGTRTFYDSEFLIANWTVCEVVTLDAFSCLGLPIGLWHNIMPGSGPAMVLTYTKGGKIPVKWFSPVERGVIKPALKHLLATVYIVNVGRLLGAKWPAPEYVPLNEAWRVTQWMAEEIRRYGGCCLDTFTSLAVRVCQAAKEKGLDLNGARFITEGEPLTPAKRKEIEVTGAAACPVYGFMEAGIVGTGCFNPASADDTHVFKDSFALIPRRREVLHSGINVDAFLFTTLLPSAPKLLLNVESGDYGVVTTRSCDCKLGKLGLTDHISGIFGFDKLTGSGMTFIASDLVRILEEVLPVSFGGSTTDYQIIEEEDEAGHTRLSLLVSPEVRLVNEDEIVKTFLAELSKGTAGKRMMTNVWSQAKILRVKRMHPIVTARGKFLPLHIIKDK